MPRERPHHDMEMEQKQSSPLNAFPLPVGILGRRILTENLQHDKNLMRFTAF